jgi:predicted Co/Zn/Cd cation transporter (cation efflux family)
MSQKATDTSALMLAGSVVTMSVGGATSLVLIASDYADPAVIAMICAAPVAIAVPILAVARMLRGAKTLAPETHNHNYNAPVEQHHQHTTTQTRGIWAKTTNHGN